jgi:hypothetical protein
MITAVLFGAFHGINPAMGWLFAVFLALQRKDRRELWRSLLPIAVGHGLSVGLVVGVVAAAQSTLPVQAVRWGAAVTVLVFGIYRLARYWRHMKWSSLNVSHKDLVIWSFLGATSHGSGLMVTPLVLGLPGGLDALWVVLVHTVAMLAVMAGTAVIVHDRVGLMSLRRWWVNFDLVWAVALVAAGGLSLLAAVSHTHAGM